MVKRNVIIYILIGLVFFSCKFKSQEDFYYESIDETLEEHYNGVVVSKFYDKFNHGINKVLILDNNNNNKELDFVYEKPSLYEYIRIGDTLIKEKGTLKLRIKRVFLDTIIELKLENIKRSPRSR